MQIGRKREVDGAYTDRGGWIPLARTLARLALPRYTYVVGFFKLYCFLGSPLGSSLPKLLTTICMTYQHSNHGFH